MIHIKSFNSNGRGAYDISSLAKDVIEKEKVKDGLLIISVLNQLCALTMIEYEVNLIHDLGKLINEIPSENDFVKLSLFQKSLVVPITDGDLFLGSFQQITLIDLNKDAGERGLAFMVITK